MPDIWRLSEEVRRALWSLSEYEPSPEQLEAHLHPARNKLILGGERAGKSRWGGEELLTWVAVSERGDGFWIVGPDYIQTRGDFKHLMEALAKTGLLDSSSLSMPVAGSWRMLTRHGVEIVTRTSSDPATLSAIAPKGVLMAEAGQQSYEAYLRARGRVAEKRGPLVLSGTLEGSEGWYPALFRRWQTDNEEGGRSFSIPTWSNTAIYPGGWDDPEIQALRATFPEDVFFERFGAQPRPPATLVFREFDPLTHVRPCPIRPDLGVQLWIDPGWAGAYAVVVVQIHEGVVYQIDEVYAQGMTAQDVIAECQSRPWWKKVTGGVIDIAGRQHHGMESHIEIWRKLAGVNLYSQKVGVADGILRHRTFLLDPASKKPRLFHDPRCVNTIREYSLYRYREMQEGRPVREDPIDADNHCVVGETLIDTPGGRFPIKDLVGTRPWVYCVIDGQLALRRADAVFPTLQNTPVVKVMMDRGEVICTPDHLFMTAKGEWVEAQDLKPAQSLMALNRHVQSKVIAVIPWGTADVYDLTVPEAHNFVANGVVMHNSMKAVAYGLVANFGFVSPTKRQRVRVRFRR